MNKTTFFISILAMVGFLNNGVCSDNITITSVTGEIFEVTPDSLSKAYESFLNENNKINIKFENFDGTISIRNPRLRFDGKIIAISDGIFDYMKTQTRNYLCSFLGFGRSVTAVIDKNFENYPEGFLLINGGPEISYVEYDPKFKPNIIKIITCKKS